MERTRNMPLMVVTLDVSKLSGWLNALASCRVKRRACNAGRRAAREACQGVGVAATQAGHTRCGGEGAQGRGCGCRLGGRACGGAHVKHLAHGCDAGGVQAQWLVELVRLLPRVAKAGHTRCGASCRPGGARRRATAVHAACTGERVRLQIGGQGVRRCTWNISRIVVTRDVSKFSGWLNANARCGAKRRRFYDAAHGAGRAGGGGCSRMWHKR